MACEETFRELCQRHGIPLTHQRQVLFEVMRSMQGHPSPEEVYGLVRERIPSISLATVYKNIHLFIESGLFREVSQHHGTQRIELNSRPHHHLVCRECRSLQDIDMDAGGGLPAEAALLSQGGLPEGFRLERCVVEWIGLCPDCQSRYESRHSSGPRVQ
jgi:Fur family peroxide stress response transcriptional regulator